MYLVKFRGGVTAFLEKLTTEEEYEAEIIVDVKAGKILKNKDFEVTDAEE